MCWRRGGPAIPARESALRSLGGLLALGGGLSLRFSGRGLGGLLRRRFRGLRSEGEFRACFRRRLGRKFGRCFRGSRFGGQVFGLGVLGGTVLRRRRFRGVLRGFRAKRVLFAEI